MLKQTKKQRGITLIALVITIIVLLILAAITINALSGDNGILKRAKDAKEQTNEKNQEEMGKLDNYENTINQYADGTTGGGSGANFTNVDTAKSNPAGALPEGSTVIEPDANKGIVIKDKNNNEWVWIEVPKDEVFSGLTIDTSGTLTDQNYEDIKNKMIDYAQTYRSSYTDEWYDGCGLTQQEYTKVYQTMLKSIYTYGGFWIGRYESGIEGSITDLTEARTSSSERITIGASPKAISQKDAIPYNYVYCSEAQMLANEMTPNSSYTSSLMFGIQWDLVCKFLERELIITQIKDASMGWGNYCDAKIENIASGKYAIDGTNSQKLGEWTKIISAFTKSNSGDNARVLLGTGISEYTKKMNIYDFAGNEAEFTLEKSLPSSCGYVPCVIRGADYIYAGYNHSASWRQYAGIDVIEGNMGFRTTLYAN